MCMSVSPYESKYSENSKTLNPRFRESRENFGRHLPCLRRKFPRYWVMQFGSINWITHSYTQLQCIHSTAHNCRPKHQTGNGSSACVSLHCLLLAESSLFNQLPTTRLGSSLQPLSWNTQLPTHN
jgi:hypothetical protein